MKLPLVNALELLEGDSLSSVVFIHDYMEFHWKNANIRSYLPMVLFRKGAQISSGDDVYRDEMFRLEGKRTARVEFCKGEHLDIEFADGDLISVSLRDQDYVGPEAIEYTDPLGKLWVI